MTTLKQPISLLSVKMLTLIHKMLMVSSISGLIQYMDSAMSDPAGADDQTPLGGTMYFQLTMANPVSTLDWVH